MSSTVIDRTFNFKDRGKQTILWFDLFDECEYGADKLYFRGRFTSLDEVREQVKAAILDGYSGTEFEALGAGNPLKKDSIGGIALNRYVARECMGIMPKEGDPYPYRALYAVHFRLRVKFHNDFGYIDFGYKWLQPNESGKLQDILRNEDGSEKPDEELPTITLDKLQLLQCSLISGYDANVILAVLRGELNEVGVDEETVELMEALAEMNPITSDMGIQDNTRAFDVFVPEDNFTDGIIVTEEDVS